MLFREHCRHVCLCLVQEETVKTGFCHESVRKQEVWLLRNGKLWEGRRWMNDRHVGVETASDIES